MAKRPTIQFTTGTSGSGKSYVRCARFLCNDFLVNSTGKHYSNFPLGIVPETHAYPPQYEGETFADRIARHVHKKTGQDVDAIKERICTIPEDELKKWKKGTSGPDEFFVDIDLSRCHVAIDEIHNYCGRHAKTPDKIRWQELLGEIRHRGATVECISQHPQKVAREIIYEAEIQNLLVSGDHKKDPFFRIKMSYWYELLGAITKTYTPKVWLQERRQIFGRWIPNGTKRFELVNYYFQFYDSFSAPQGGGGDGAPGEQHEFEKRSKSGLLWWFTKENPMELARGFGIIALILFLFSGGMGKIMVAFVDRLSGYGMPNATAEAEGATPPTPIDVPADEPETLGTIYYPTSTPDAFNQPPLEALQTADHAPATPDTAQESQELQDELDAAYAALKHQTDELAQARTELDQSRDRRRRESALVLLTPDRAVFRNGYEYQVGERIDFGDFEGHTIVYIDYYRRALHLSDGNLLRLGRPDGVQQPAPEDRPAGPTDLP